MWFLHNQQGRLHIRPLKKELLGSLNFFYAFTEFPDIDFYPQCFYSGAACLSGDCSEWRAPPWRRQGPGSRLSSSCTQSKLMLACRMTNHSHITALAWGSREKVLQKSTDPTPNPLNWKVENGTKWYYYEETISVSSNFPSIIKKKHRSVFFKSQLSQTHSTMKENQSRWATHRTDWP